MDFLVTAVSGTVLNDALTVLAFEIIKLMAFGALGVVAFGFVLSLLCDVCECRKLRQCHGQAEAARLMP
jgi:hypothetical protein